SCPQSGIYERLNPDVLRTSDPFARVNAEESLMKTIILAGGLGTRLSEETSLRPKPMVEIGGKPILWHIMNIYSAHGYKDFIIACGYKAEVIKEYFSNFMLHNSDLQFDFKTGRQQIVNAAAPDWKVAVVDTGTETLTGGRLRRLKSWLA